MDRKQYASFCRMMGVRDLLISAQPQVSTTPSLYTAYAPKYAMCMLAFLLISKKNHCRFLSKYFKEAIVYAMCNRNPHMHQQILDDGSMRRWALGKEKIVKSLVVRYKLTHQRQATSGAVESSSEVSKTAFLGILICSQTISN
jgi:hypothetical protein